MSSTEPEDFWKGCPIPKNRLFSLPKCEIPQVKQNGVNDAGKLSRSQESAYAAQFALNQGLSRCLKGGVIMDVTTPEEALIAERAGAVAVMALERVPFDIRKSGGIARMSDPGLIRNIKNAVTIPVMAKVRIGHTVEAQVLEALEIDFIDESEVLTPADANFHINKTQFKTPFVCGAATFKQALKRIQEGATMIRTKGEAGTGDIIQAVAHARDIQNGVDKVVAMTSGEIEIFSERLGIPTSILNSVKSLKRLPVVNFSAGGIATPSDAALMMQMGMDGVFVGSGIFKSSNPAAFASAIVKAVANYRDPILIAKVSENLGVPMQSPFNTANQQRPVEASNKVAKKQTEKTVDKLGENSDKLGQDIVVSCH